MRRISALTFSILIALTAPATADPGETPRDQSAAPTGSMTQHKVTLITGDTVTVTASADGKTATKPDLSVKPGPGREDIAFSVQSFGKGGITVVPSDALALVAGGRLDLGLFNVTTLIASGYEDAKVGTLPVIAERADSTVPVSAAGTTRTRSVRPLTSKDKRGEKVQRLGALDMLRVGKRKAGTTWKSLRRGAGTSSLGAGVGRMWLDAKVSVDVANETLDQSTAQVTAPGAWARGYTGQGVTVAVLDTGWDQNHPDLQGVVTQAQDFTGSASGVQDKFGHGTHVSSIIAGSGAASGGVAKGVAPNAKIAMGKVCTDDGACAWSAILAGIDWAVNTVHAKVVNMSLGGYNEIGSDPLENAVNGYTVYAGTLFVVAAGNSGSAAGTINTPGSAQFALTVGAVDATNTIAAFSGRGSSVEHFAKPDVVAPGVQIVAARAAGTSMGSPVDANYTAASGTSMATPHVAGVAALLAQEHPGVAGIYLKGAITGSAVPISGLTTHDQGYGLTNALAAVDTSLFDYSPINATLSWPHAAGQTANAPGGVIMNSATAAVTLNLTTQLFGASGTASSAPLLTLAASQVTIAAGATDSYTVVMHGDNVPAGLYTGVVTGKLADGTVKTREIFDVYVEPELYTLHTTVLDRTGAKSQPFAYLWNKGTGTGQHLPVYGGDQTFRLPAGDYALVAQITTVLADGTRQYTLADTPVRLGPAAADVTLDARLAQPLGITVDEATAVPLAPVEAGVIGVSGDSVYHSEILLMAPNVFDSSTLPTPAEVAALTMGRVSVLPAADQSDATYFSHTTWAKNGVTASPYRYDVYDYRPGGIPATPGVQAVTSAMAHINVDYRAQGVAGTGQAYRLAFVPHAQFALGTAAPVTLPSVVNAYVTPDSRFAWRENLALTTESDGTSKADMVADALSYPTAGTYSWQMNNAVIGLSNPYAYRYGDFMVIGLPGSLFTAPRDLAANDLNATGTLTVDIDGQPATSASVQTYVYPAGTAAAHTYHVALTADRSVAYSTLSTRIIGDWTFSSARTPIADGYTALPMISTRFLPESTALNSYNRAAAGSTTTVYIGGSLPSGIISSSQAQLTSVEVSTNDGSTWQASTILGSFIGPAITVTNPASGFVSLRATWTDPAGSISKTTVIRAYQIGS
jgi:subtilisin family serine protease